VPPFQQHTQGAPYDQSGTYGYGTSYSYGPTQPPLPTFFPPTSFYTGPPAHAAAPATAPVTAPVTVAPAATGPSKEVVEAQGLQNKVNDFMNKQLSDVDTRLKQLQEREAKREDDMDRWKKELDSKLEAYFAQQIKTDEGLAWVKRAVEAELKKRDDTEERILEWPRKLEELRVQMQRENDSLRRDMANKSRLDSSTRAEAVAAAKREIEEEISITRKYVQKEMEKLQSMVDRASEMEEAAMRATEEARRVAYSVKQSAEAEVRALETVRQLTASATNAAEKLAQDADNCREGARKDLEEIKRDSEAARRMAADAKKATSESIAAVEAANKAVARIIKTADDAKKAATNAQQALENSQKITTEVKRALAEIARTVEGAKMAAAEAQRVAEGAKASTEDVGAAADEAKRNSEEAKKTALEARRIANETVRAAVMDIKPTFVPGSRHQDWVVPSPQYPKIPVLTPPQATQPVFPMTPPAPVPPQPHMNSPLHSYHSSTLGDKEEDSGDASSGTSSIEALAADRDRDRSTKRELNKFKQTVYDALFDAMTDARPLFQSQQPGVMGMPSMPWQMTPQVLREHRRQRRRQRFSQSQEGDSDTESASTSRRNGDHGQGSHRGSRSSHGGSKNPSQAVNATDGSSTHTQIPIIDNVRGPANGYEMGTGQSHEQRQETTVPWPSGEERVDESTEHSDDSFHSANLGGEVNQYKIEQEPRVSNSKLTPARSGNRAVSRTSSPRNRLRTHSYVDDQARSRSSESRSSGRNYNLFPMAPGLMSGVVGIPPGVAMSYMSPSSNRNGVSQAGTTRSGKGRSTKSQKAVMDLPAPLIQQVFVTRTRDAPPSIRRRVYVTSEAEDEDSDDEISVGSDNDLI